MCAVQAGFMGKRTLVLEKNGRAGAKILISGGGRCNYTNLHTTSQQFISGNPHFCKSALGQWTVDDTINFFETYGIVGQEKTLGQLFPTTNKAKDIVDMFTGLCADLDQPIWLDTEVKLVQQHENGFNVSFERYGKTNTLHVPKLIIATGGLPVHKLGATDFGLRVARQFGLNVIKPMPALVPLTITGKDQPWYEQLSGNSIFCKVWNDKINFEENILFTHWGLSGPAVLQLSSYWQAGEEFYIDMLPNQNVTELILAERLSNPKRSLLNLLAVLYTRKFAEALGGQLPVQKNLASLSKADVELVEQHIHHFKVKPAGDKGYDKAEVMRGGIDTAELSSKTLEVKKVPGLYFGGECVDVTGWLGGYNFQWAWAAGFVIAQNI